MPEVISGAVSGFMMGLVFVTLGVWMLFSLSRNPPPLLKYLLDQVPLASLGFYLAFIAMALWGMIGLILGAVYRVIHQALPGPGLGSPNLAFTLGVMVVTLASLPPLAILLRRVLASLLGMMAAFVAIFGWFMPFFAG